MFRLGRYNDAKEWIGKSLKNSNDNSATVLEHYGDVLFKLGDSAGALDYWQRARNAGEGASEFWRRRSWNGSTSSKLPLPSCLSCT